jgi:hypothetical protein
VKTLSKFTARWGRPLVIVGAVLFGISVAFPLAAGLVATDRPPTWIGVLDVVFALAWAMTMMVIGSLVQGRINDDAKHTSYRLYRGLAHLLLVLLVTFFLFGDRINWTVLLLGLAWRLWLLVYTLPAALTLWRKQP